MEGDTAPKSACDPSEPAAGGSPISKLLRRASWNLFDQVLSALTNVTLSFVVAREVAATSFGAFAVAFILFGLVIGLVRSIVGTPLSILHSAESGSDLRSVVGDATGATLGLTLPISALVAAMALVVGPELSHTLLALAVVLPGLILQDTCRMIYFAQSNGRSAAANDAVWAVLQFAAIAVLLAFGAHQPWLFVMAWGSAATICAAWAVTTLHVRPRITHTTAWIRERLSLGGYLFAEYLMGIGIYQGGILALGGFLGQQNIGSLRAALVLLGPLSILATAMSTFLLPEVSRRPELSAAARTRLALGSSLVLVVATAVYTAVLLVLPQHVGVALLGDTWEGAREVLLPMATWSAAAAAAAGPAMMLYAMGLARSTFRLHVIATPMIALAFLVGGYAAGAVGAAWCLAALAIIMLPLWCLQLASSLRHRARDLERIALRESMPVIGAH